MATADWQAWCKDEDLAVVGDTVEVTIGRSRKHRITVDDVGDAWRLAGVVVGARRSAGDGLELDVWQRNRRLLLAGMRFDAKDRLIGENWVPKAGLTRDEFVACVRILARACDRYEHQLTGEDRS